jgi:hypothetical protein
MFAAGTLLTLALGLGAADAPHAASVAARRAPSPPPQTAHATVSEPSAMLVGRYGPLLTEAAPAIPAEGCMDAAWHNGLLYVISRDRLCVFRPGPGATLTPVGELGGLGSTRQIELFGHLAGVTAREDGLWLIDVSNPARPQLLSHYDTIELATGIAMSDHVALVACRQYGIEQIDISDPRRPRHLSTFRTGEAQSVFLQEGLAYIGDWGTRELVICDLHNPWRPAPVAHLALDGFGDGVFVRGKTCFAATGHHSRNMRQRLPTDPAYGLGHGLEIIDVSNPQQPKLIARAKLPRLYRQSYDMWDVQVSGNLAVVGDTHNGIYVFDIRDLAHPVPVGYHRLPVCGREQLPDAVGGFAIGPDCLYVAGAQSGLHTLALPGIRPIPATTERLDVPATRPADELKAPARVAYRPAGQVHEVAVDPATGDVWVAAGTAGLHHLRLDSPGSGKRVAATQGVVFSVDARGGLVAAGEGMAGLSLWRPTAGSLELLGRYRSPRGGIGQVCIAPDKQYAVVHAGPNVLEIVDIRTPQEPNRVLDDQHIGLFYRTPFSHGFLPDGRFGVLWHASGMYIFTVSGEPGPRYAGWTIPGAVNFAGGMAACGDRFLVTTNGGYALLADGQTTVAADRDLVRIARHRLEGKPSVFGTTLYVAQRWKGIVEAVDIAVPRQPKLRWSLTVEGNPGPVEELAGQAVIPAGYEGVIVRPAQTPDAN